MQIPTDFVKKDCRADIICMVTSHLVRLYWQASHTLLHDMLLSILSFHFIFNEEV